MKEFRSIDKALAYLIQEYGINILTDSRRCINMLSDIIPDQKGDINLIKYVFDCELINTLISANSRNDSAKQQAINRLNHELVHKSKIKESTSSEICSVFVSALGWNVVIPNDVEKEKQRKEKNEKRKTRLKDFGKWIFKHIKVISIIIAVAIIVTIAYSKIKPWYDHRNKIHFTNPTTVYEGNDYKTVYDEFTALGFTNIKSKEIKDINEAPSVNENKVIGVKINGDDEWLDKDTLIVISYHGLSDTLKIYVPFSSEEVINQDINKIQNELSSAGFKNINTHKNEDLKLGQSAMIGKIEKIEIDDIDSFNRNALIPFNANIIITYHDYPINNYVAIPDTLDNLKGTDYTQVKKQFSNLGCTNITTEKVKDITIKNENTIKINTISEISINESDSFNKGDMIPVDSKIVISYHDYSDDYFTTAPNSAKNYKGKNYLDVESELHKAGFVNIECKPIRDVKIGLFTEVGETETVSINDSTSFKKGDSFAKSAKVVIKYHAKKGD